MTTLRQHTATFVLLAAAALCFWKGLPGLVGDSARANTSTTRQRVNAASTLQHQHITTVIQDLRVGMRVVGRNPLDEDAERDLPEPDPATWRLVRVRMEHKPAEFVEAELLRPLEWIEATRAKVGEKVWLDFAEMHTAGFAEVLAIEESPAIESGTNPIITGTFKHVADNVVDVHVEGQAETIGCTAQHPFWSDTREDFVEASDLEVGEEVLTAYGNAARITSIVPRAGPQTVYGLEVYGEHVYHLGQRGLLAHNASGRREQLLGAPPTLPTTPELDHTVTVPPLVAEMDAAVRRWRGSVSFAATYRFRHGLAASREDALAGRFTDPTTGQPYRGESGTGFIAKTPQAFRYFLRPDGPLPNEPRTMRTVFRSFDVAVANGLQALYRPIDRLPDGSTLGGDITFKDIRLVSGGMFRTSHSEQFPVVDRVVPNPVWVCGGLGDHPLLSTVVGDGVEQAWQTEEAAESRLKLTSTRRGMLGGEAWEARREYFLRVAGKDAFIERTEAHATSESGDSREVATATNLVECNGHLVPSRIVVATEYRGTPPYHPYSCQHSGEFGSGSRTTSDSDYPTTLTS